MVFKCSVTQCKRYLCLQTTHKHLQATSYKPPLTLLSPGQLFLSSVSSFQRASKGKEVVDYKLFVSVYVSSKLLSNVLHLLSDNHKYFTYKLPPFPYY